MKELISEKELLAHGLSFVRVDKINGTPSTLIYDVERYLDVCKTYAVPSVMYCYSYYEKADYLVTDEFVDSISDNAKEKAFWKSWKKQHNTAVDSLDFERPNKLVLITVLDRFSVGCVLEDDWLDILPADKAYSKYREGHETELMSLYEEDDMEDVLTLSSVFRSALLDDDVFRNCTNKRDRERFISRFMADKDFWNLTEKRAGHYEKILQINAIANRIYNDYRQKCWDLKIPVGKKLPDVEE